MLYLLKCNECDISKRFYRFYDEKNKVCLSCQLKNTDDIKIKDRIKRTLYKQSRNTIWKNRFCLACELHFESCDNIFKCIYCTEEHNKLFVWNSR